MNRLIKIYFYCSLFTVCACYNNINNVYDKKLPKSELSVETINFNKTSKVELFIYGTEFNNPKSIKIKDEKKLIFEGVLDNKGKLGYVGSFLCDKLTSRTIYLKIDHRKFKIKNNEGYSYLTFSLSQDSDPVLLRTNYIIISDGDGTGNWYREK